MQEITGAKPVRDASFAPKAFGAMHSFGMGISSVQFRVGAQFCFGGHAQSISVEPALRRV